MRAFVATLGEIFKLKREEEQNENFDDDIRGYVIPKYQREYKWTKDKVLTLIQDINKRDKFLGNIILEKNGQYYEIVDGQQRITTSYLILIVLYNCFKDDSEENLEQKNILGYLMKNHEYVLKNDSIGEFLWLEHNDLCLKISEENDIYEQKKIFTDTYDDIKKAIENNGIDINEFEDKLLDCKFLVLINDEKNHVASIEEMFLDINFKSQLLDEEAIFKGYCFKNYKKQYHEELKNQWVKLKKCSKQFEKWGYEGVNQYLYHFLLSIPGSHDIPKNLSPNGIHYLDGKNNNETKKILDWMVCYGECVIEFYNDLCNEQYYFANLTYNATSNNYKQNKVLKQMCKNIISISKSQYHKFPFFMMVYNLKKDKEMKKELDFDTWKKIITNYYIYSFVFMSEKGRKGRKDIDQSIFKILYEDAGNIKALNVAVQNLRKKGIGEFEVPDCLGSEQIFILFSIIDYYDSQKNFLPFIYATEEGYTKEHFLIHDNRKKEVIWKSAEEAIRIELNDVQNVKKYKSSIFNYLVLPEKLNAKMEHDDIVSKITMLKDEYKTEIPKHIDFFVQKIENMSSYQNLVKSKGMKVEKEQIEKDYKKFIEEYFDNDHIMEMKQALSKKLRSSFNHL